MKKMIILLILATALPVMSLSANLKESASACDKNNKRGCFNAALFYHKGLEGTKVNYFKAFSYYKKSCDLNHAPSCANLSDLYLLGHGIRQDLSASIILSKKSCELGNGISCYNLGNSYFAGRGVKKNLPIAKEFYGLACDKRIDKGCSRYADLNY